MLQNPAHIAPEEMRKLLGDVWAQQFLKASGNASKGRRVAEAKKCVNCYDNGPGPSFAKLQHPFTVLKLTSALWAHGPNMLAEMKQKNIAWPRLTTLDVENLLAYIDSPAQATRASAGVNKK